MFRRIIGILTLASLPLAAASFAAGIDQPGHQVGTLMCRIMPHSGVELLIHSTSDVKCTFTPAAAGSEEHYKGETGIGFGIDIDFNRSQRLAYAVIARSFRPGSHQLAGKYGGIGGSATLGLSVGGSAPLSKADGSITLQPVASKSSGSGFAAGSTYLYLEPERE